jgi:hypothetical protein
MRTVLLAAVAAASLASTGAANATVWRIDFNVAGDWMQTDGSGLPYGFTSSPTFSGWFTVDDTDHFTVGKSGFEAYPGLVAASVNPGNQIYTAADIDPGYGFLQSDTPGSAFNFWSIGFNHPGSGKNYVSAFQAGLYDGADGVVCTDCVTWSISEVTGGVPEPTTWAMMILGIGLTGAALRHRRTAIA